MRSSRTSSPASSKVVITVSRGSGPVNRSRRPSTSLSTVVRHARAVDQCGKPAVRVVLERQLRRGARHLPEAMAGVVAVGRLLFIPGVDEIEVARRVIAVCHRAGPQDS